MDYFKHYSTASEGYTLNLLMDKFRHQGYSGYMLLTELCCLNWDGKCEPKFTFYRSIVRKKLRISDKKLNIFLAFCDEFTELECKVFENNVEIYHPNLKEIKETRGRISGNKNKKTDILDKNRIDKEEDIDGINDLHDSQHRENGNSWTFSAELTGITSKKLPVSCDSLIQLFNDKLAGKAGKIQYCRGLSANQIKEFITTSSYKEFSTIQVWEELFEKVSQSPFLAGTQDGSTFVATLDWLIVHGNALKVLSGKYPAKSDQSLSSNPFANMELN